jgi:hypothetical protein
MGVRVAWLVWAVVWLGAGAGAAENAAPVTRVGIALPVAGPIVLDGVLDEPSWAGAVEVSGFSVSGGEDLAPQQTVLRVLYDATHLYVAIVCVEPAMDAVRAAVAQRDGPFWEDDAVELFLDPAHAHDDYFQYALAAGGGCYDGHNGDSLWTSGWKAVARREAGAWTCEGSVPFADLKAAPPPAGALWGFNACRERRAGGTLELYNWADVQRVFSTPSLYGHLAFVERGWTASGERAAAIARRAGGAQALVFVGDGYWTVKGAAAPQYSPYADDVAAALGEVPAKLAELATLTAAEASPLQRQRLAQLQQDHDGLRALLGGGAAVRAAAWAQALGTVQGLRLGVETLYWQVKLAALNRSMP